MANERMLVTTTTVHSRIRTKAQMLYRNLLCITWIFSEVNSRPSKPERSMMHDWRPIWHQ